MSSVPCFKNLKGFPIIKDGSKIEVKQFLEASQEVVKMIEFFGKIFTPVVIDIQGNINILKNCHQKDVKKILYLDNLLEVNPNGESIVTALLWLKRTFHLLYLFLTNMLNDEELSENVRHHLHKAYEKTLKPYHGILIKATVSLVFRWLPKRSDILGTGLIHDENIKAISEYLPNMQLHIIKLDEMLTLIETK